MHQTLTDTLGGKSTTYLWNAKEIRPSWNDGELSNTSMCMLISLGKLNDIFKNDFNTITFAMYPIYLNIGFGYAF